MIMTSFVAACGHSWSLVADGLRAENRQARGQNSGGKVFSVIRVRIPMMVMGDSDLIVMVVSERNDHHDRSEATLTL
jgi:hypothetical protein